MIAESIVNVLLESHDLEKLKQHRKTMTPEEKAAFPKDLPNGDGASTLKAVIDGQTWYACYTHRCCHVDKTLKGCVAAYPKVASTA